MEINKIYNEDNLKTMAKMPNDFIDLIITSPPYEDVSGAGYGAKSKDILFLKFYSDYLGKLFSEYERILKPTGQIYFNIKSKTANKTLRTPHWIEFLEGFSNLKLKSYIIWKYSGSFDSTNKRFHLDYEIIYHLSKTDDIYLNEKCGVHDALSSVWNIPHNIPKTERVHPTQMPEALVERILKVASKGDELIYDSFMGSGTTAIVCNKFGLKWIGSEMNTENFEIAEKKT
jgi:site-specific DNA-methyltransferase (adenine-specific)